MALFTPTNQKRLTNVSVVRLRKGGTRYELACYPNKVRAWREKLESNLNEVLQIQCVFTNVSKGQFANKKEMFLIFRTEDETQIIKTILEEGELQLTEKERAVEQQSMFRDVAKIVSERCVNPETNRAYTITMIEKMMKDCHISLKANKSAKQHALEVIRQLRSVDGFKIAPAMMEVVISIDVAFVDRVKDHLLKLCSSVLREGRADSGNYDLAVVIEPDKYGAIETLLRTEINGKYCIEVVGNTKHGPRSPFSQAILIKTSDGHSESQISGPKKFSYVHYQDDSAANEYSSTSAVAKPKSILATKPRRRRGHGKHKSRDDWPDDEGDDSRGAGLAP